MGRALLHGLPRRGLIVLHDLLVAGLALPLALLLRDNFDLTGRDYGMLLWMVPVAVVTAHLAFLAAGTYRALWRYATIKDLLTLIVGATAAVFAFVLVMFLWDRLVSLPRSVPIIQWLLLMVGLCGSRLAYSGVAASRAAEMVPWQPVLLVGAGDGAALVARLLEASPGAGWRPVGILDPKAQVGRVIGQVPILGGIDDFRRVVSRLALHGMRPQRLVITTPQHELSREQIRTLQQAAYAERIPIEDLPTLVRFRGERNLTEAAAARELREAVHALEHRSYLGLKRFADIAISLSLLVLLSPLLLVMALAVRLSIGSPILFRQVRPGRGLVPFTLYKFRSMRDAYGADGKPLPDAARTPLVGRILRRTRLDELPQFWNVLWGDMAIIGPRPLLATDLAILPDQGRERANLRPGITGWAQVNGGHQLKIEEKLALDLWYVRHASVLLDLKIAFLTLRMMVMGEQVDGDEVARATGRMARA